MLEWNIKKGLLVSSLMQLKKNDMGEGWISNTSAGLCLDFISRHIDMSLSRANRDLHYMGCMMVQPLVMWTGLGVLGVLG